MPQLSGLSEDLDSLSGQTTMIKFNAFFKCMCMTISGNENMAGGCCSRATGGAESTAPVHHLCVHCVLHSEL